MRVLTIVGVALGGAVSMLSAQHAHQLELGGFGTYTHFDSFFGLNSPIGGGGRVGASAVAFGVRAAPAAGGANWRRGRASFDKRDVTLMGTLLCTAAFLEASLRHQIGRAHV